MRAGVDPAAIIGRGPDASSSAVSTAYSRHGSPGEANLPDDEIDANSLRLLPVLQRQCRLIHQNDPVSGESYYGEAPYALWF